MLACPSSRSLRTAFLSSMLALSLAACGPAAEVDQGDEEPQTWNELGEDEKELLKGTINWTHPAIGQIIVFKGDSAWSCTATLIAPNVLVTAAHCVDYTTKIDMPEYPTPGYFKVFDSTGEQKHRAYIQSWVSFGAPNTLGGNDVAVIRLRTAVPSTVATPMTIASASPWWGNRVDIWGMGCTNDSSLTGSGDKRVRTVFWGGFKNVLCPGDSGGPGVNNEKIFAVNSSYCSGYKCSDTFGNVPRFRTKILSYVTQWK